MSYEVCCTILSNSWMSSSLHSLGVPYFRAVFCLDVSDVPLVLPSISSLVDFATDPFSTSPSASALHTPCNSRLCSTWAV